jgi:hypothetical protein
VDLLRCEYCGESIRYDEDRPKPAWVHSGSAEPPCVEPPGRTAWPRYLGIDRRRGPRTPWGSEGVFWQAEVPGGGFAYGRAPDEESARRVIGILQAGRTVCPGCSGHGATCCARAYVGTAGAGTLTQLRRCETCDGQGWLPGAQPPA